MSLTGVNEAEVLYGVAIMLAARRRDMLETSMIRWLYLGFSERIWPFDRGAARAYAKTHRAVGARTDRLESPIVRLRPYPVRVAAFR